MDTKLVLCFLSIAVGIIAICIAFVGCSWIKGVSRNPESSNKLQISSLIILSLLELPLLMLLVIIYMFIG